MTNKGQGLVLVYTGDGKGKTTAAIGVAIRAKGQGKRVCFIQFIKAPGRSYGEKVIFDGLGIENYQTGVGFTWTKTPEEHREALKAGWALAKEKIMSGNYDLVILDELNNALAIESFPVNDVIPIEDILTTIDGRPKGMHLVITGRSANEKVMEMADLITEMKPLKHYYDKGIPAVEGIEF
ncbi:cob(I)yrinic acid a,c-diamide adenosyltransferase [Peribacillus acanthi]|uniref:cob(I)yrinic acid a,c-diamide adenosyltransferase n=1 Tax=Peribacillus acanthi TaxID=2171554 RepID=UPI001F0B8CF8|nr:cob(I)yrinic acid a,c-diamide adenosyltransferase [Peribacillus acanthi]